jgi:hypothetical protein
MQSNEKRLVDRIRRDWPLFKVFAAASVLIALLVFSPVPVRAQMAKADILGTVTDSTGAVVPGAKVTLLNTATGISASANSDAVGEFLFSSVQIGTFKMTVEAKGFKTFVTSGLTPNSGDRLRVSAVMQVGNQVETVEVAASAAAVLQTDTSNISSEITNSAVDQMPLNGRNYYNLIGLQAGTNQSQGNAGSPTDNRQPMAFTANGQNYMMNNNLVDGMDNNERSQGTTGINPSADAVQEVNVQTSLYSAEYSRTGGGIANLITKSGTNAFHGSLYEFMRNDAFDTLDWSNHGDASKKNELRQNQFGGSIGGPIRKNKAFFFGDYQGWRQIQGKTASNWTLNQANYDAVHAYASGASPTITLSDPFGYGGGGTQNPSLQSEPVTVGAGSIYGNEINPIGLALLMTAPKPTCEPGCVVNGQYAYNYTGANNTVQNSDTYDARVDYHFNDRNTLFGRYSYNKTATASGYGWPASKPVNGLDKTYIQGNNNPVIGQNLALDYVHIFNPSTIFEGKAAYLRSAQTGETANTDWSLADLGMTSTADFNYNTAGVYGLPFAWLNTVSGNTVHPEYNNNVKAPYNVNGDGGLMAFVENTFQYNAALTLNRKSHSIKAGITSIRRQINSPTASHAQTIFAGAVTGNVLGDMLLGYTTALSDGKSMAVQHLRMWEPSAYVQDDWRVTPKLTLNLGVRYDVYTAWTETQAHISNFDLKTGLIVSPSLAGANGSGPTAGVKTDYGDIAPRVGFAYSLPGSMVIRGGWGMSYFPGSVGGMGTYFMNNAPFQWTAACGDSNYGGGLTACNDPKAGPAILAAEPFGATDTSYFWKDQLGNDFPYYNMKYGFPTAVYATDTAVDTSTYSRSSGGYVAANFKASYLMQYNLQLQKQYKGHILTVGYVGNQGRRMPIAQNLNQATHQQAPGEHSPLYSASTPWMDGVNVNMAMSAANTAWEAGEATYQWNSSHGFTANVNFTWARTEAQGTGVSKCVLQGCPMDDGSGTAVPVNGWQEYNYDGSTSHRAAGMLSYAIPFGNSLHGPVGAVVKGWTLSGVGNWNTGAWSKVSTSVNQSGITAGSSGGGPGGGASEYPNRVWSKSTKPANRSLDNWVNPEAFVLQAPGMLGNGYGSSIQMPRSRDIDLGLSKTFSVWENVKLEARADAFNFTNTPNYGAGGGGPGGPGGPPGGGGGPTTISNFCPAGTTYVGSGGGPGPAPAAGPGPGGPAGKCSDGSDANQPGMVGTTDGGFGAITSGSGDREFQFSLRIKF